MKNRARLLDDAHNIWVAVSILRKEPQSDLEKLYGPLESPDWDDIADSHARMASGHSFMPR